MLLSWVRPFGTSSFFWFHFVFFKLDDPFTDPPGLIKPPASPTRPLDNSTRIAEDEDPLATLPEDEEERIRREKAAAASALTLEMVGDLPFANVRPPENVLFVCKLNPVTRDEDLELIFSRFGNIMSCQVIRDKKTGDSLQYAFIEFDKRDDAEQVRNFFFFHDAKNLMSNRLILKCKTFSSTTDAYGLTCRLNASHFKVTENSCFLLLSSQSVARLNTHWSNDIIHSSAKRSAKEHSSSFAGRDDLEQTRRYRREDFKRPHGNEYGMVFDVPADSDRGSEKKRKRNRSRDMERDQDREGRRKRPTSPGYSSLEGRDRDRQRERDRHGHGARSRSYDRELERRHRYERR